MREAAVAEEEIAVGVNAMPVDGFDLLPGTTAITEIAITHNLCTK